MKGHRIILGPAITEKGTALQEAYNRYAFRVTLRAGKPEIRRAVEELFKVKVIKINTMRVPGKPRRWRGRAGHTSAWKKALVTLAEGQTIDFFKGA